MSRQRRRMLRRNVAIMSRRNALESVLALLTESGIAFTVIWVSGASFDVRLYLTFDCQAVCVVSSQIPNHRVFANTMTVIVMIATVRGCIESLRAYL